MSERISDARLEDIALHLTLWRDTGAAPWASEVADTCLAYALELLAEVDRLRALLRPDPNEEARLVEIRRWAATYTQPEKDTKYLLARLDATQGQFADFLSDHHALILEGAAQERRRVLDVLDRVLADTDPGCHRKFTDGWESALQALADDIGALPPLPEALPPEQARREADRLRQGVREALGALIMQDTIEGVVRAEDILRSLLGEK